MADTQTYGALSQGGITAWVRAWIVAYRAERARRRIFVETRRALAALGNRDLADMGLTRSEISRTAYAAAYDM